MRNKLLYLLIIFSTFFVSNIYAQEINHNGEKWSRITAAELDTNPDALKYKKVYLIIENIHTSNNRSSLLGKSYFSFSTHNKNSSLKLWVSRSKKKVLDLLYNFTSREYRLKLFLEVKRKRRNAYAGYEYFVIIKDCIKTN